MHSHPYRWPWDHDHGRPVNDDRLAVMVCGWQPHWLATVAEPGMVESIGATIAELRSLGATVMWVRTGAATGPSRRPPILPIVGSSEWELLPGVVDGDIVVDTPGLDAFLVEWTDLELRGRGLDRLVMCGLGTEGPVSSTNRSANDRGYECLTATDAIAHHDDATGAASLSSVCMSGGIFGAVGSAADLISDLTRSRTGTPS